MAKLSDRARANRRKATRDWQLANPKRMREYKKKYKLKHADEIREKVLAYKKEYHHRRGKHVVRLRKYGLTQAQFESMMRRQKGACPLCRREFHDTKLPPAVDHDHALGHVRGLLCMACNRTLGAFDSIEWLIRATKYMRKWQIK